MHELVTTIEAFWIEFNKSLFNLNNINENEINKILEMVIKLKKIIFKHKLQKNRIGKNNK